MTAPLIPLRILGRRSSVNVRKVLWTCGEIGLYYKREDWGMGFASPQTPEFLALNPNGTVPVLVDEQGPLWESNVICRYLATEHKRAGLLPETARERALVEQWMDWQASDFNASWRYAFLALVRRNPAFTDAKEIEASLRDWNSKMAVLERQLSATGAYLTGKDFTVADIVIGLSVNRYLKTPQKHGDFPAVAAYHNTLLQRPACQLHAGMDEP